MHDNEYLGYEKFLLDIINSRSIKFIDIIAYHGCNIILIAHLLLVLLGILFHNNKILLSYGRYAVFFPYAQNKYASHISNWNLIHRYKIKPTPFFLHRLFQPYRHVFFI